MGAHGFESKVLFENDRRRVGEKGRAPETTGLGPGFAQYTRFAAAQPHEAQTNV